MTDNVGWFVTDLGNSQLVNVFPLVSKNNHKLPRSRYYVLAVVILPVVFYIPKFFEVRSREVTLEYMVRRRQDSSSLF